MMLNILFCVDDSAQCQKAADIAINLFQNMQCSFTLLHIGNEIILYSGTALSANYDLVEEKEQKRANDLLESFAVKFRNAGLKVNTIYKNGQLYDILIELTPNYNLLVIGQSSEGFLHKIFNSKASDFIEHSPIPVLIAK